MMSSNYKFINSNKNYVYMRTNKDSYKRRGGLSYVKHMLTFRGELYRIKFYNFFELCIYSFSHLIVILMPNKIRKLFYKLFLRKK